MNRLFCYILLIILMVGCVSAAAQSIIPGGQPVAEWFDEEGILRQLANELIISTADVDSIKDRLFLLSLQTVPPDWGYAGMLMSLAEADVINNVDDVNAMIDHWENNPQLAEDQFRIWNDARLGQ